MEAHNTRDDTVRVPKLDQARLRANFDSEHDPQVTCRTCPSAIDPRTTREEKWKRQKFLGCGGFGTVILKKCIGVFSDVEVGNDDNTGNLRAFKRIRKARNQRTLSKKSVGELNGLVFFSSPTVSMAHEHSHSTLQEQGVRGRQTKFSCIYSYSHSMNTTSSRPLGGMRALPLCL